MHKSRQLNVKKAWFNECKNEIEQKEGANCKEYKSCMKVGEE